MKGVIGFLSHFYLSAIRKDKREWEVIFWCVATSGLFWLLNAMGKTYEYQVKVPIQYHYNRNQIVALSSLPSTVSVSVEGRGWDLLQQIWQFQPRHIHVHIPEPLKTNFILPSRWSHEVKEVLSSVKVNFIEADTIYCRFDRIEKKLVGLFVDLKDIRLRAGYQITSPIQLSPRIVEFEGAASLIRTLPDMLPVKIDARNINASFDQNIPLDFSAEYPKNNLLTYKQDAVNVRFTVRPALEQERELPLRAEHQDLYPNLHLKETLVLLTYLVGEGEKESIKDNDFEVVADFETFNSADSTVEVRLLRKPKSVSDVQIGIAKTRVYAK